MFHAPIGTTPALEVATLISSTLAVTSLIRHILAPLVAPFLLSTPPVNTNATGVSKPTSLEPSAVVNTFKRVSHTQTYGESARIRNVLSVRSTSKCRRHAG